MLALLTTHDCFCEHHERQDSALFLLLLQRQFQTRNTPTDVFEEHKRRKECVRVATDPFI